MSFFYVISVYVALAIIIFLPYFLRLIQFRCDIGRYNKENPDQPIPIPKTFRDLRIEFKRFLKLRWSSNFLLLYYHYYYVESDDEF